jgi:hypothetical protein
MTKKAVLCARDNSDGQATKGHNLSGQSNLYRIYIQPNVCTFVAEPSEDEEGSTSADLEGQITQALISTG